MFAGNSFDVSKPLADKLYTYCVKSGQTTCLAQTEYTIAGVAHVGDRVFYNGMDIDFSSDICSVPLSGGEQVVEYVVQEDMGFQNSGDSCRGGGTAFVGAGDDLYFTKSDQIGRAHV